MKKKIKFQGKKGVKKKKKLKFRGENKKVSKWTKMENNKFQNRQNQNKKIK